MTVFNPIKSTPKMLTLTRTEKAIPRAGEIPNNENTRIITHSISPNPAGVSGTNIRIVMRG